MASILLTAGTLILLFISGFMILIILMQRANTNAGLGTAFGGGVAESAFGADTGNVLTKGTIISIIGFFVLSLMLYLGYMSVSNAENAQGLAAQEEILKESAQSDAALDMLRDAAAIDTAADGVLEAEQTNLQEAAEALGAGATDITEDNAAGIESAAEEIGEAVQTIESVEITPAVQETPATTE